jgi:hypothetical protein
LSEIVEKTAREFGIPYHAHATLAEAGVSHIKALYRLGHQA